MILGLADSIHPDSIGFSCKDGIDITSTTVAELFTLLKFINSRPFSEQEEDYLRTLIFAPAFVLRGRVVSQERFGRMHSMLRCLEMVVDEQGSEVLHAAVEAEITPLFSGDILQTAIFLPEEQLSRPFI